MYLVKEEIQELIDENIIRISPYDPSLIDTVSIDVRVGNDLKIWTSKGVWEDVNLSTYTVNNPYMVNAGDFFLTNTLEYFEFPNFITGVLTIKSSMARKGYNHSLSGLIKPKFNGCLTMEFKNYLTDSKGKLPVYYGLPIVQIKFIKHTPTCPKKSKFDGHYKAINKWDYTLGK